MSFPRPRHIPPPPPPPWHIEVVEPENDIDPDDGVAKLCRACTLPIFSTPFKKHGADLFVHDECYDLPKELSNHVFHRGQTLVLTENQNSSSSSSDSDSSCCITCKRKCGSMMYKCSDHRRPCDFQLDLLCALQITIMHRSHKHRLTAITASASFTCGACRTQHPGGFSRLSYLCKACDYWIHPDCASLPNAIKFQRHHHSLFLTFNLSALSLRRQTCAVCKGVCWSMGVYFCAKCDYHAHIKCAILTDPHGFEPVLVREANLAGLRHLPMADEETSLMPYIMELEKDSSSEVYSHPHPLIFHHQHDSTDDQPRVCSACVQLILPADPFHECSECPDFFLHKCCANLPTQIKHPYIGGTLFLFPKAKFDPNSISGCFVCHICKNQSNGFAYVCKTGDNASAIDVVCAMMPPSITHHLHTKSHILYLTHQMLSPECACCKGYGRISYKCTSCRNFKVDVGCARLPSSIKHKFDDHILTLTAGDDLPKLVQKICEICEDYIELKHWCYSCKQCDQWFHPDCIRGFSNLKLGATIKVKGHDCPLALILESSVYGYHCDSCLQVFRPKYTLLKNRNKEQQSAYECSNCYFRMHERCAKERLLE